MKFTILSLEAICISVQIHPANIPTTDLISGVVEGRGWVTVISKV